MLDLEVLTKISLDGKFSYLHVFLKTLMLLIAAHKRLLKLRQTILYILYIFI